MNVDLLIDISEDKRRTKTLNFLRDAHKNGYYFPSDTRQAEARGNAELITELLKRSPASF